MEDLFQLSQALTTITLNLMDISKRDMGADQNAVTLLHKIAIANGQQLGLLFPICDLPVNRHQDVIRERIGKNNGQNLLSVLKGTYSFIQEAEPVLKRCSPEIYHGTFTIIKQRYTHFMRTHMS